MNRYDLDRKSSIGQIIVNICIIIIGSQEILGNTVGPNNLDYNQMKLLYQCSGEMIIFLKLTNTMIIL